MDASGCNLVPLNPGISDTECSGTYFQINAFVCVFRLRSLPPFLSHTHANRALDKNDTTILYESSLFTREQTPRDWNPTSSANVGRAR